MAENETPFERKIVPKIQSGQLTDHQRRRLEQFLGFEKTPLDTDRIDFIVVLTASPLTEGASFQRRIQTTIDYSRKYPIAQIVFSGKHPDVSRAKPEELKENYSEAAEMARVAESNGLEPNRVSLESTSANTKEGIEFSLNLIQEKSDKPINVLFIGDRGMGRRINLYVKKALKDQEMREEFGEYFIIDAAKQLGTQIGSDEPFEPKKYEIPRLARYRSKGDL